MFKIFNKIFIKRKIKYKGTWKDNQYHGWGRLYNHNQEKGEVNHENLTPEAIGNKWV